MDDDEDVICVEAHVPTNARTPRPVDRNDGAVHVHLNGEGSKSSSSSDRRGILKKQQKAQPKCCRGF